MLIIFSKKKKRLVLKAIANTIIFCTTNQNGKTTFNYQAANLIGITLKDLETLSKIGRRFDSRLERAQKQREILKNKVNREILKKKANPAKMEIKR